MKNRSDSLSGKNMDGRIAGADSTSARSAKAKTKLWNKLRELDRRISKNLYFLWRYVPKGWNTFYDKDRKEYDKLDQQRKEVRAKLKNS